MQAETKEQIRITYCTSQWGFQDKGYAQAREKEET
jgi:hypothetical protein